MSCKVELIPIAESEGNRITVKQEDKVLVGRGSSLGVRRFRFLAAATSSTIF